MSWTPLSERFAALPLILSGPLLRRVEPGSVTVWLALKEPRWVTLRIYRAEDGGKLVQLLEDRRHTIRLGDRLHLVAVTARANRADELLMWGELYFYNVFFQVDEQGEQEQLETPGVLLHDPENADPLHRLIYPGYKLPSFELPPQDVNKLRVIHGSCRKPHGVGREMLSALDTILATSLEQHEQRPQQVFLSGDQIYADDVAGSLLYALTDCGDYLLMGNQEEVLPLVGAPARALGPGGRVDAVRSKARLTTTTPHNHLLSFGEYASMCLFAWSDALWPDELPDAQEVWQAYPEVMPQTDRLKKAEEQWRAERERLHAFRDLLPNVRRALANTPTYMICDDHEITDDWYLDGAWCQQVLASPLGRRVLRNALLAYALFQAWGNTPEQFMQQDGTALLEAVDAWRGEEENEHTRAIEASIGLPDTFSGSGTLAYPQQALQWHYTYEGPRYQVIVMDTRTQRMYHAPNDFPGLLSPDAMHEQVASAVRADAEVSIIVSATPVLGIDFIESVQFWSRLRVRDNYAYDCEAWALEWGTFQHFLKTVSAMQRVVLLSGDVHYAFGASMEYWDPLHQLSAKIVDYTSSPFCNEGSGSHIAVLAVGYPGIVHRVHRQGTATLDFFAWDITSGNQHILDDVLKLIRKRLYLFWWSIPRLLAAHRSPYEIVLPAHGWLKGAFSGFPPDRIYRLRYLANSLGRTGLRRRNGLFRRAAAAASRFMHVALGGITFLEKSAGRARGKLIQQATRIEQQGRTLPRPARTLARGAIKGTDIIERQLEKRRERLVDRIFHYAGSLRRWKAGGLIIGYNNIGDISFQWSEHKHGVIQRLWWRDDEGRTLLRTEYRDELDPPPVDQAPPLP